MNYVPTKPRKIPAERCSLQSNEFVRPPAKSSSINFSCAAGPAQSPNVLDATVQPLAMAFRLSAPGASRSTHPCTEATTILHYKSACMPEASRARSPRTASNRRASRATNSFRQRIYRNIDSREKFAFGACVDSPTSSMYNIGVHRVRLRDTNGAVTSGRLSIVLRSLSTATYPPVTIAKSNRASRGNCRFPPLAKIQAQSVHRSLSLLRPLARFAFSFLILGACLAAGSTTLGLILDLIRLHARYAASKLAILGQFPCLTSPSRAFYMPGAATCSCRALHPISASVALGHTRTEETQAHEHPARPRGRKNLRPTSPILNKDWGMVKLHAIKQEEFVQIPTRRYSTLCHRSLGPPGRTVSSLLKAKQAASPPSHPRA